MRTGAAARARCLERLERGDAARAASPRASDLEALTSVDRMQVYLATDARAGSEPPAAE